MKLRSLKPNFKLTSQRVHLEVLAPTEASRVAEYYVKNKDFLAEYSPVRSEEYFSEEFWKLKLADLQEDAREDRQYSYFLIQSSTKTVIGSVTFSNIVRGFFQACYLGYNLSAGAEGFGYMNEALQLGIHHLFEDLNFHRIMANYVPTNIKSERVLSKLGFIKEGIAKDYLLINGVWRDHVLTSLTNQKWINRV